MNITTEQKAIALSQDKKQLRKRLIDARSCLIARYMQYFPYEQCKFDFENKRLLGANGWYLQWKLRENPEQPESYENQQTSCGRVDLMYPVSQLTEEERREELIHRMNRFFDS